MQKAHCTKCGQVSVFYDIVDGEVRFKCRHSKCKAVNIIVCKDSKCQILELSTYENANITTKHIIIYS